MGRQRHLQRWRRADPRATGVHAEPAVLGAGFLVASITASEKRGHASSAHGPYSRSVRQTSARSSAGSTHRNVPAPAEVAERLRGVAACPSSAGPCRRGVSKPRPQSSGSNGPTPGSTPLQPGNGRPTSRPRGRRLRTSVGRSSSPASASEDRRGSVEPLRRPVDELRAGHAERLEDPLGQHDRRTARPDRSASSAPSMSNPGFE